MVDGIVWNLKGAGLGLDAVVDVLLELDTGSDPRCAERLLCLLGLLFV